MCGRFALLALPEEVQALFGYLDAEDFPPRYNIAPTQPVAIVRAEQRRRRFALVRWGLVPGWVKDPRDFSLIINARAEGILERPAFRAAMQYRRCLIPASGFYEWRKSVDRRTPRQPFWVRPPAGGVFAFAGLWETWSDRDGGEIDSAAIVTTDANGPVAAIHDRMPVVILPGDYETWLSGTVDEAVALLRPPPADFFETSQISDRVNNAANDDPGLIAPVAPMRRDLFSSD